MRESMRSLSLPCGDKEEWADRYSDDTPLIEIFAGLDGDPASRLHSVISRLNVPGSHADSTFA
jgi:hypothetical protein